MSELREAVEEYLTLRRSLGFALCEVARLLRQFVNIMDTEGQSHITTEVALRWARQPANVQPATWACRLAAVRRFAYWRSATDPRTEVPPDGLLPDRYRRRPPYIYSDDEIEKLILGAGNLRSSKGFRPHTYETLFGLLAATGMRVSEAVNLDQDDVDLRQGILRIRRSKFGKSRLVPVHVSTCDALKSYDEHRNRLFPASPTPGFFISERASRITHWSAEYTFAKVSQQIGLRERQSGRRHGRGPRLHDMRHRFAVQTLINWYRADRDVEREMPKLSTYLGHVHVADTYWYIEAVPELLQLATDRLVQRRKEPTR